MWENIDFDQIDKELRWARSLGFSKFRVFLHISPYMKDKKEYLRNILTFLTLANSRGAHIIPVLFDDCWNENWADGDQPEPVPGLHNSQWVQCPGKVDVDEQTLKSYVVDIIGSFRLS